MQSERKKQILDTAERLFSENGYHATSMRDLARALDLQGGSLYSHISGKEELLERILERAANEFLAAMHATAAEGHSPAERLRAAIHSHVRVITSNLDAATVYFHEWRFLSQPQRAAFLARRDEYERLLRQIVADAVASGQFRDVEPRWAALLILSVMNWMYLWYDPGGPMAPDEIAEKLVEMIFRGLEQPPELVLAQEER